MLSSHSCYPQGAHGRISPWISLCLFESCTQHRSCLSSLYCHLFVTFEVEVPLWFSNQEGLQPVGVVAPSPYLGSFLPPWCWRKTEMEVPGSSQNGTTHQPSRTSSLVPSLKLWHNNMIYKKNLFKDLQSLKASPVWTTHLIRLHSPHQVGFNPQSKPQISCLMFWHCFVSLVFLPVSLVLTKLSSASGVVFLFVPFPVCARIVFCELAPSHLRPLGRRINQLFTKSIDLSQPIYLSVHSSFLSFPVFSTPMNWGPN